MAGSGNITELPQEIKDAMDYCNYHLPGAVVYGFENVSLPNKSHGVSCACSSNDSDCGATSDSSKELIMEIERILLTRVVVAICAFGVVGNIFTLAVLLHRRWQSSKRRAMTENSVARADILGLICLSFSDLLFCVSVLPHATEDIDKYTYTEGEPSFHLYFYTIRNGVINTFIMTSTWLTVSMTINRYTHLCHPMLGLRYFTHRFMVVAIVVSTVFSVVFNMPRYWFYKIMRSVCYDKCEDTPFVIYYSTDGFVRQNKVLEDAYHWIYFFIGIMLPLCVLAYSNCRIIYAVYNSVAVEQRRNRERNLITKVLICIVLFYLILVSPAEVIKFFSTTIDMGTYRQSYNFAVTVLNTFQAVNFSCNFLPYMVLDKKVRSLLTSMCRGDAGKVAMHGGKCSRYESVTNYTTAETIPMRSSSDLMPTTTNNHGAHYHGMMHQKSRLH